MSRMPGPAEHSLAVPEAALQRGGEDTLVFDGAAWSHLRAWLSLAERLPPADDDSDAAVGLALARFGSPEQLRRLLRRQPRAISDGAAPAMPYAALVWWIQALHASAELVVAILQRMPALTRDGWPLEDQLRLLAGVAGQSGRRTAHLALALTGCRVTLLAAHQAVAAACRPTAERLQDTEAAIEVLHERIGRKEREIARHGLFGAHRKHERMAELHALQRERAAALAHAGRLQARLGALDALREEGAWLEPALESAIVALAELRSAWALFRACMSELRCEPTAGAATLPFDRGEAIARWSALQGAAERFAASAMSEIHLHSDRNWSITTP